MALIDDKSHYIPAPQQDNGVHQLWTMVLELSEQLSHNRVRANALYAVASNAKHQAVHSKTGFVLRRFNADISQEQYLIELERMNENLGAENMGLLHDNKNLGSLIREYEHTLENLMSTFRNRAREVQDRELSIVREYESKLLALEEENVRQELAQDTRISETLARLSHLLRQCMRLQNGEEPLDSPAQDFPSTIPAGSTEQASERMISSPRLEAREVEDHPGEDHALEREIELSRLEKENEELKRMLGLLPPKLRGHRSGSGSAYDMFPPYGGRPASQQRMGGHSPPRYGMVRKPGVP